jgi:hypothetical protein
MHYCSDITRANPTCFLFLIDQSRSMAERMAGAGKTKAEAVADSINLLLCNLCQVCQQGQLILDRLFVGVLGYGLQAGPALAGPLAGRDLVPISEVAANPVRVDRRDKAGGGRTITPVWFDPQAQGKTPMCATLTRAATLLERFLVGYPDCFPPMVINITDGKATDGDPEGPAAAVRRLASSDGNVLLFNAHISSRDGCGVMLPEREDALPDEEARRLFRMSSPLPPAIRDEAERAGYPVSTATRGFVLNANLNMVVQFLRIGTSTASSRPPG